MNGTFHVCAQVFGTHWEETSCHRGDHRLSPGTQPSSAALRYVCLLGVIPPDWFPSTSVLSSVLSPLLRLPRISSSCRLFADTFASDEEKHYAWMKRGRGKAAAVGEIIHIAEDKCIFSTRLIPCTQFQPPCTSTSFYIPRSSRIILFLILLLFLTISAATCATWLRQNE